MAEKWDERYKIAENEPVGVLSECAIAELGILMEDDYQEAASLLGMDEYLPYIRTCSEKGSKLLRLWSSVRGNQANFRIMKTLFSQRHRAIVDKLDDLMWCHKDIFVVWSYRQNTSQTLFRVPRKVPIRIALNSFFSKEFPNREVIFEVEGHQDLNGRTCGDFVGGELNVIIRAVEEPEEITSIPGYYQLTREQAVERLSNQETGTYLIRPLTATSDNSKYAVSTVKNGQVYHFRIYFSHERPTSSTQYFLFDDGHRAYRLESLITYYKDNNFSTNIDIVPVFKLEAALIININN